MGPAPAAQSYLNIPRILEVIKKSGAQAVHPGYGFLSENMHFAKALEDNGVAFIGPGSKAVKAMGDKIESKELAIKSGVNTVPGVMRVIKDADDCMDVARKIGYPVMIKASAGGGGKGMRIAWNDDDVRTGFRLSKEESKSSFGDDRVFVEKYVVQPRHIEIQVLGDSHGNVVAFPERECSIQRRNQKVLEEAPSSFLDPKTRAAMQEQAVMLAKAVEYKSAGTVEFLVDKDKNFYFLEMNTRLQVEHPITELITGVDLVEQMIRVAAGHKLPEEWVKTEKGMPFKGWAHEARVYAEDPFRGFLPSIGRLVTYIEPTKAEVEGVRVDTGVTQGSEISKYYDPMISKLCTYADTRLEALSSLEKALDNYVIKGVGHNIPFLRDVVRAQRFKDGRLSTNYIPEEYPEGFHGVKLGNEEKKNLACVAALVHMARAEKIETISDEYVADLPTEVVCSIDEVPYKIKLLDPTSADDTTVTLEVSNAKDGSDKSKVVIQDFKWDVDTPRITTKIGDKVIPIQYTDRLPSGYRLTMSGAPTVVNVLSPVEFELSKHMIPKKKVDYSKWLQSPMPGTLVAVHVKVGDTVFAGQPMVDIEAMKMLNSVAAPKKGKVKAIFQNPGATLAVDENIIEFE